MNARTVKTKIRDKIDAEGEFSVYIKRLDQQPQLVYKEDNLIIKAAKQFLLQLIALPDLLSDPITQLRAGTGGTIDPQGLYPKPEDPDQIDLISTEIIIDVTPVIDLDNLVITYLADLDIDEGNGFVLSEAGLFKQSGLMFNIKNHPGIPKTPDFSVHYEWRVRIL